MADKIIFMNEGKILQMGAPEELLENPADKLISAFMGNRTANGDAVPQTVADFMRTNVYTIYINRGIREAIDKMARCKVDTLLVKNLDETYAGTVSVKSIKQAGLELKKIETLVRNDNVWSYVDEDAQECFDKLLNGHNSYLIALNRDNTIAGIVTMTSMAKSLAEVVWGGGA